MLWRACFGLALYRFTRANRTKSIYCVRLSLVSELNPRIEFDWVRFSNARFTIPGCISLASPCTCCCCTSLQRTHDSKSTVNYDHSLSRKYELVYRQLVSPDLALFRCKTTSPSASHRHFQYSVILVIKSCHTLFFFVFPKFVDWNRSKSIITRNCVIDFYRLLIFVDWSVSNMIDNYRFLLTIEIINVLHLDVKSIKLTMWLAVLVLIFTYMKFWEE